MIGSVHLVVNPRAGRGRAGKELGALTTLLADRGIEHVVHPTQHGGHATELAVHAARTGAGTVVAVGGDGTVNEVVNGLMALDEINRPSLGVVVAGSGADFARTFDLPQHIGGGLAGVVGETRPIDVGRIEVATDDAVVTRHFANIANVGIAAATVERAERLPRWLGKARYIIAFWPVLVSYQPEEMRLVVDGESHELTAHNLLVANARYAGGGMYFSPHSEPDDGVLDVQMNVGPKRQAFTLMPKIFRGSHLPNDRVHQASGRHIVLEALTPQQVEADGELIGVSDRVTFTVVPGALRLVV
jgi:YegS/Rv2252/BmrU family lipid kinase